MGPNFMRINSSRGIPSTGQEGSNWKGCHLMVAAVPDISAKLQWNWGMRKGKKESEKGKRKWKERRKERGRERERRIKGPNQGLVQAYAFRQNTKIKKTKWWDKRKKKGEGKEKGEGERRVSDPRAGNIRDDINFNTASHSSSPVRASELTRKNKIFVLSLQRRNHSIFPSLQKRKNQSTKKRGGKQGERERRVRD